MDRDVLTLARLARILERACGESQPPLTLAQYRLLAMLGEGESRASHLAVELALTRPTVSATVDTLVERGLVERAAADDDRRVLRLTLSNPGRSALRKAEAAMRAHFDDVLEHVEHPDDVRRALVALADGLDARRVQRRAARARS